jgi:hypothetical protein
VLIKQCPFRLGRRNLTLSNPRNCVASCSCNPQKLLQPPETVQPQKLCCILQLSNLHVEEWQVLSHIYGTYTCNKDPSKKITTAEVGNIHGYEGVSACWLLAPQGCRPC